MGQSDGHCASMAAGGLVNPVTGRWAVKSWRIDDLLPLAESTYRAIESSLGISVYHPLPLRRYCLNADDVKRVQRRMRNPRYDDVLGPFFNQGEAPVPLRDEYGSFAVKRAAYLDMPRLLEALRARYGCIDEKFEHEQLAPSGQGWQYKGISAKRVFFCEGAAVRDNPWFRCLPVDPIKGETLLLEEKEAILPRGIFHHQKWILSHGNGRCRTGSTYDEKDASPLPTREGADILLGALHSCPAGKFELLEHKAGLRPTTPDTRPIAGSLPGAESLYILNGLGSKGASTAPLMCRWLLRHVLEQEPLDPEVDCKRFTPQQAKP